MGSSVCFYFQVHQPYRMRPYRVLDIGSPLSYFDEELNREIAEKVARKCYLPTNKIMLELIKRYPGRFKIAYSISGVALEQFEEYTPEVLASFKELAATGQVEFLAETYYHSLSALFDRDEFTAQVEKHREAIKEHFGVTPTTFRNTELIYSNGIADMVEDMGFTTMLTEGVDRILDWRSPNFVYEPVHGRGMKLLLKNYKLSDDIAFRFSQRTWPGWPLTTEKFAHWVHKVAGNSDLVNLFMDYETFGEHQWEDTGIFTFLQELPEAILQHPDFDFVTPSEAARRYPPLAKLDIPDSISWADQERDLSAWLGNPMQDGAISWVYRLGSQVKEFGDPQLVAQWRRLQTSDHFYYMCVKYWSDGDVHKHFSCYESPHEAYVYLGNILTDIELRLGVPTLAPTPAPLLKKAPTKVRAPRPAAARRAR
jgi:alpha-amylase